ncbi:MAG: outer membrane lipoprotein carrier protein LolA [Vulcanimicrobiota bacterium]
MRKYLTTLGVHGIIACVSFVLLLIVFLIAEVNAAGADGRQYIERLYSVKGQKPVEDMVIELEESVVSQGAGQDSPSMVLSGKDKIYFKSPHKLRIDSVISDPGGELDQTRMVIIRDGKSAWQYLSTGQFHVKWQPDEPSAPLNIPFGIVKYPQDSDKSYTITGTEKIDNVEATVIKITCPTDAGEEITVWVDSSRQVPLKMFLRKKTVLYKEISKTKDGRFFPFRLEIMKDGVMDRVVIYKALAINAGLDETLFAPVKKYVK